MILSRKDATEIFLVNRIEAFGEKKIQWQMIRTPASTY